MSDATLSAMSAPRPSWQGDALAALVMTLAALAIQAVTGFPSLADSQGDSDSLLRLVEVRDLLGGQNWFDLTQYRMGPEGGFVMHWSRLVDAPLAGIILAMKGLGGGGAFAETVAAVVWPALLYGLTVFFTARAARRFGGAASALPAAVLCAAAIHFIAIFRSGALDHHNIQLMLTMAGLSFLLAAPARRLAGLFAGISIALTLAIGMETAPYVAVIGLCVAGLFAFGDAGEKRTVRDFGLGFAGISAIVFIATVPPTAWRVPACDAFSVVQFVLAALAGTGLAVAASFDAANRTLQRRLLSLGLLGAAVCATFLLSFPQCLAGPYANVDPLLRTVWLDNVAEAQSLFKLAVNDPASVVARYVTPLLALALLALRLRRNGWRRADFLVGAVLAASFLVSVWQVRGSTFSIAFAVIPLANWVASWRERASLDPSRRGVQAGMAAVWLLSLNVSWMSVATAASIALKGGDGGAAASTGLCGKPADFAALAAEPRTTVLAISDLGSPILAYSGHRALAGPYHRNIEGSLAVLHAFMGSPDDARALVRRHHVGLVALCDGDPESGLLARDAPDGLLAQMMRGAIPAWLEPVAGSENDPVKIYRVRQAG